MTLKELIEQAKEDGWAAGEGRVSDLRWQLNGTPWTVVRNRKSGPEVQILTPTAPEGAAPASLSATYGAGPQPLHTDGAHQRRPPDLLILSSRKSTPTSTRLWRTSRWNLPAEVRHGVFLVTIGPQSFFTTAANAERLRFDPGCMSPCDARARAAVRYFQEQWTNAAEHRWTSDNLVLVIENRWTLHARDDATADPDRMIERIAIVEEEAPSGD